MRQGSSASTRPQSQAVPASPCQKGTPSPSCSTLDLHFFRFFGSFCSVLLCCPGLPRAAAVPCRALPCPAAPCRLCVKFPFFLVPGLIGDQGSAPRLKLPDPQMSAEVRGGYTYAALGGLCLGNVGTPGTLKCLARELGVARTEGGKDKSLVQLRAEVWQQLGKQTRRRGRRKVRNPLGRKPVRNPLPPAAAQQ